jgi:small multidrug resistance family-3 protein
VLLIELQTITVSIYFYFRIRRHKGVVIGLVGATILFLYGIIPTLQPANFGRIYAAYVGFFIICLILWGMMIDKKKPDKYELIGSAIAVLGAAVIFYTPR